LNPTAPARRHGTLGFGFGEFGRDEIVAVTMHDNRRVWRIP
jgi:hypothetical protein